MSNEERRRQVEERFGEEIEGDALEELSPSGRFRLRLRYYRTGTNTWNYSRCTVTRVSDGAVVCDLKRNYGNFPRSFVQKDANEWLITGRSYMSQTIINLDTGEELEPDNDHYNSGAFCWVACNASPDSNTLLVDGCVWGAPYEYRFFDFSNPRSGWPEIPIDLDEPLEPSDAKPPVWNEDGTIECYETAADGRVTIRTRLRRDGSRMKVVDRWISDMERQRRAWLAEDETAIEAWRETFQANDPLWKTMISIVVAERLPDDVLMPHEKRVRCWFRRAHPRASADLEWTPGKGSIFLRIYDVEGMTASEATFDQTVDGMKTAMAAIVKRFA